MIEVNKVTPGVPMATDTLARQQAELNSVQLIDRDRLISLLEQYAITRIDVEGLA